MWKFCPPGAELAIRVKNWHRGGGLVCPHTTGAAGVRYADNRPAVHCPALSPESKGAADQSNSKQTFSVNLAMKRVDFDDGHYLKRIFHGFR